jgi:hypothetical protein
MNCFDLIPISVDVNQLDNAAIQQIVRLWRNAQLTASDWTQLPDVALTSEEVQAWAQYRHELREMLKQNDDPKLIVFPEPPQ